MADPPRPRPPLVQGALLDGEVTALAPDGARAAVPGGELRVPLGVPGDRGAFRVLHVGRNAAWGRLHALATPSPDRVEPPCPVVERCGGCPWQPVAPARQRAERERAVEEALAPWLAGARRHGWVGPEATAGPDVPTGYRTRALMMARRRHGRLELGLYAPGTNDVVPVDRCAVQDPRVNDALEAARAALDETGVSAWEGPARPGTLKALLLRLDPAVGDGLLTVVTSRPDRRVDELARRLADHPAIAGVFVNANPAEGGPVLGEHSYHLAGAARQRVTYGDLALEVGPTAFLQTHHAAALALVEEVARRLPARMEHLVDLYAGVGVLGLAVRDRAARVTLVESAPAAVDDALHNAARLGAAHVAVRAGDAAEAGPAVLAAEPRPDAVLLDPPRAGCAPDVLDAVAALPAGPSGAGPRVVYVSCGLRALARDLAHLAAAGLRVTDLALVDMFPHTAHVEVVVALSRGPAP